MCHSALGRRPTLTVAYLNRGSFTVWQVRGLRKVLQWFGEKLSMALPSHSGAPGAGAQCSVPVPLGVPNRPSGFRLEELVRQMYDSEVVFGGNYQ